MQRAGLTASLDPASVLMIENILTEARQQGTKVILITHDLGQARRLAEEVLFLNHGRLLEQRDAEAFFDAPRSEAAKAYLEGRIVL